MIGKDKVEEILKEFVDGQMEQMAEEKFGCKLCDLPRRPKNSAARAGRMGGRAKRAGG